VPGQLLRLYRMDHAVLAGWGPVVADIARQVADQDKAAQWRFSVQDPDTGLVIGHGVTRRRPTKTQADWIAARDRRCRAPRCMVPAKDCQADHTIEYQRGGPTDGANIGPFCIRHHDLKTRYKVTVSQPEPGHFVWTTALGHTHHIGPEPPYGWCCNRVGPLWSVLGTTMPGYAAEVTCWVASRSR
jgi:hypothetical protein